MKLNINIARAWADAWREAWWGKVPHSQIAGRLKWYW